MKSFRQSCMAIFSQKLVQEFTENSGSLILSLKAVEMYIQIIINLHSFFAAPDQWGLVSFWTVPQFLIAGEALSCNTDFNNVVSVVIPSVFPNFCLYPFQNHNEVTYVVTLIFQEHTFLNPAFDKNSPLIISYVSIHVYTRIQMFTYICTSFKYEYVFKMDVKIMSALCAILKSFPLLRSSLSKWSDLFL